MRGRRRRGEERCEEERVCDVQSVHDRGMGREKRGIES